MATLIASASVLLDPTWKLHKFGISETVKPYRWELFLKDIVLGKEDKLHQLVLE